MYTKISCIKYISSWTNGSSHTFLPITAAVSVVQPAWLGWMQAQQMTSLLLSPAVQPRRMSGGWGVFCVWAEASQSQPEVGQVSSPSDLGE